jgi:iron(III) transport system substrate-binding protein
MTISSCSGWMLFSLSCGEDWSRRGERRNDAASTAIVVGDPGIVRGMPVSNSNFWWRAWLSPIFRKIMRIPFRPVSIFALGAALLVLSALSVFAQTGRMEEIATYQGTDREKLLIEGAKREGGITIYSSLPSEDNAVLTGAFERKYGIKTKLWRAASENLVRRMVTESGARHFEADVVISSGTAIEPLHREKLLQEVKSSALADLIPQAIPPHREWASIYLNSFAQVYNTNLVKKQDLPLTYRDLLKPEWKGRLGVEAEDFDWFAEVVGAMGETDGLTLFRNIVATNGISVRTGHTLLANLVAAGEVPLALTVYSYMAQQMKSKGAPVDWFIISPMIARPTGIGVAKTAPHANAAVLFFDFMIGDAQSILASRNFFTTSTKIETAFSKTPLKVIDSGKMLDEADKWQNLYKTVLLGQSR